MNSKVYKYRQCPKCNEISELPETKCLKCGYDLTNEQIQSTTIESEFQEKHHFKTLLGYGKFISGFGWFVLISGIGLILVSFYYFSTGSSYDVQYGMMQLGGGVLGLLAGLSNIVFGQLISCFIAIERNTRITYEMLKTK